MSAHQQQLSRADSTQESTSQDVVLAPTSASNTILVIPHEDVLALAKQVRVRERPPFKEMVASVLMGATIGFLFLLVLMLVGLYIVQAIRDPEHTTQYKEALISVVKELLSIPLLTIIVSACLGALGLQAIQKSQPTQSSGPRRAQPKRRRRSNP